MPIYMNGEVFDDEVAYTAKVLGIELPQQDASPTPKEPRTEAQPQGGTSLPVDENNASQDNVGHERGILDNLLGLTGERYQTWPEKTVRGAISGMALPGDVLSGKVQPGSPQEIERALDLAGLMVMGPAPVASKLADGTLGSFAGVRARGLDKNALGGAQTLEASGKTADEIWQQTGFFRGADGRWRFEIPNTEMKLKDSAFDVKDKDGTDTFSLKPGSYTLQQVLDHPLLFKAYPELKGIKVVSVPEEWGRGIKGGYDRNYKTLYVSSDTSDGMRSTIVHEVQHAIQDIEGFQRGGNPSQFKTAEIKEAERNFKEASKRVESEIKKQHSMSDTDLAWYKMAVKMESVPGSEFAKNSGADLIKKAKELGIYDNLKIIADSEHKLGEAALDNLARYKSLMGEVEAVNVQNRLLYDEHILRNKSPIRSEDIPRSQQLIQFLP